MNRPSIRFKLPPIWVNIIGAFTLGAVVFILVFQGILTLDNHSEGIKNHALAQQNKNLATEVVTLTSQVKTLLGTHTKELGTVTTLLKDVQSQVTQQKKDSLAGEKIIAKFFDAESYISEAILVNRSQGKRNNELLNEILNCLEKGCKASDAAKS